MACSCLLNHVNEEFSGEICVQEIVPDCIFRHYVIKNFPGGSPRAFAARPAGLRPAPATLSKILGYNPGCCAPSHLGCFRRPCEYSISWTWVGLHEKEATYWLGDAVKMSFWTKREVESNSWQKGMAYYRKCTGRINIVVWDDDWWVLSQVLLDWRGIRNQWNVPRPGKYFGSHLGFQVRTASISIGL